MAYTKLLKDIADATKIKNLCFKRPVLRELRYYYKLDNYKSKKEIIQIRSKNLIYKIEKALVNLGYESIFHYIYNEKLPLDDWYETAKLITNNETIITQITVIDWKNY